MTLAFFSVSVIAWTRVNEECPVTDLLAVRVVAGRAEEVSVASAHLDDAIPGLRSAGPLWLLLFLVQIRGPDLHDGDIRVESKLVADVHLHGSSARQEGPMIRTHGEGGERVGE